MFRYFLFALSLISLILAGSCAGGQHQAVQIEESPWITDWTILGPFAATGADPLAADQFKPLGGESTLASLGKSELKNLVESHSPAVPLHEVECGTDGVVDLAALLGESPNSVVYALASLHGDSDGFTTLRLGSDDGIRAWINGTEVWKNRVFRSVVPDQDFVMIPVHKGENRLLLKIEQGGGGWAFCARIDSVTAPVDDVYIKTVGRVWIPDILLGGEIPSVQSIRLVLTNHGGRAADGVIIRCNVDGVTTSTEKFSCDVGEYKNVRVELPVSTFGKPAEHVSVRLEILENGRIIQTLDDLSTRTRAVHSLLANSPELPAQPFFICQLSDPHITATDTVMLGVNTHERLRQAVAEINAMNPSPDFVVVTGDLVMDSMPAYEIYETIMSDLAVPYISAYGNHDKPAGLGEAEVAFSMWGLPPYYAFEHRGQWFCILDSMQYPAPNAPGLIDERQIKWLADQLANPVTSPRVFMLHHDLYTGLGVRNYRDMAELLQASQEEKWFFAGHWHAECFARRGDERHIITTTTGYLFSNDNLKDDRKMPGYRLIHFDGDIIYTEFKPLGGDPLPDPVFADFYTRREVLAALGKEVD